MVAIRKRLADLQNDIRDPASRSLMARITTRE